MEVGVAVFSSFRKNLWDFVSWVQIGIQFNMKFLYNLR